MIIFISSSSCDSNSIFHPQKMIIQKTSPCNIIFRIVLNLVLIVIETIRLVGVERTRGGKVLGAALEPERVIVGSRPQGECNFHEVAVQFTTLSCDQLHGLGRLHREGRKSERVSWWTVWRRRERRRRRLVHGSTPTYTRRSGLSSVPSAPSDVGQCSRLRRSHELRISSSLFRPYVRRRLAMIPTDDSPGFSNGTASSCVLTRSCRSPWHARTSRRLRLVGFTCELPLDARFPFPPDARFAAKIRATVLKGVGDSFVY